MNGDGHSTMNGSCAIVENARELAREKGLDAKQVSCPVLPSCDGSTCIYDASFERLIELDEIPVVTPREKFFKRLEKTVEVIRKD